MKKEYEIPEITIEVLVFDDQMLDSTIPNNIQDEGQGNEYNWKDFWGN